MDQMVGLKAGSYKTEKRQSAETIAKRWGIMMWAGIIGNKLIGLFNVDDGVKLTSQSYYEFLYKTFFKLYGSQIRSLKAKYVFMHDSAI